MTARKLGIVYILALSLAMLFLSSMANAQSYPTATATAASFVNTGPGSSNATGILVAGGSSYQWAAVQFTLTDPAAITQVEGWFSPYVVPVGGQPTTCLAPCTVNVVIRENNDFDPSAPLPGASIWSQTYTVTPPTTNDNWIIFSNYEAVLAAGTYWVAFEPPANSGFNSGFGGPGSGTGTGVKLLPQASYAWYAAGNGGYINYVNGPPTALSALTVSGYDLGTAAAGSPLITSGTFARTITSGTVFNTFPFTQDLGAIGGVGQADTSQWNIYAPAAVANAYGTVSANPKTQGDILSAGAYSATGTNDSGAARGIVFSTFLNTTGSTIPNLKVNAALDGSILSTDSGSPVTVTAAVYVFDPADFTYEINQNVSGPNSTCGSNCPYYSLAQFLLGGSNVIVGDGAIGSYQYDLTNLFNNYADDSWGSSTSTAFPLVCTGTCTAEASTAGTQIPPYGLFTVMFDVMAASEGSTAAQSQAIGDFLSTLQADLTHGLFTDGSSANNGLGKPINGILGPIATTLPDTPASIALSQSATTSQVGTTVTLTAAVTDATGNPVPNAFVRFVFASTGPHAGNGGPAGTPIGTDQFGNATLSFTDTLGKAGTDSITANIGSLQAPTTATILWTSPGPLYSITLLPNPSTITLPNSQTYTATGSDIFGNPITTDASGELTFTISPDGTCTGNTCTPTASGMHTVTGSYNQSLVGMVSGTATLNVNSATTSPLTITASSPSMIYGGTVPAITPLYTYGSLTLSTTAPSGLTAPTCSAPGVTSTSAVGPYPTSCSGASDSNYTISYTAGSVTVGPAPLQITAASATMTYGGTVPPINTSNAAYATFVNGDGVASLGVAFTCSTTATSSSPVASYPTSCSGAVDTNYSISYVNGSVTVGKAALVITASSGTMTYGGTPPTITAGYSGFVNSDSAASLSPGPSCSTTATSSSAAGSYASSCSGAMDANYSISYVNGSVTVGKAALVITASSGTMTYGGTPPTITAGYSGFVNSDSAASLSPGPSCSTTATSTSAAGSYASSCSGAMDANYSISYVNGSVTVGKAALVITASSGSMTAGTTPPAITPGYSGFVAGNTSASLTTQPTCVTSVTSSSSPGTYDGADTCSGAVDPNYTISYVAGNMVVNPAGQTPTFTITPEPPAETVTRGVVGGFILKLQSVDGFDANVNLSCSGGPAGSYCVDFPMTVKVNGTDYAVSGILFPKNSNPGTYVITFTGVSGSQTVKSTATFTVK